MKTVYIRIFISAIFLLFCFSFNLKGQSIQPLGIRIGTYSISPYRATSINTYCMDQNILTERGYLYTQISVGKNTKIFIGNQQYPLQEAIDKGFISFTFDSSVDKQMKMSIKNHTNKEARLNVNQDLVLSDVGDSDNIKSTFALNSNIASYNIPRQQIIWFSHSFENYLNNYASILAEKEILKNVDEISLDEYLKIRNVFLQNNGIADITLVKEGQSENSETDYAIDRLLTTKEDLNNFSNDSGQKLYILRFGEYADGNYYYLDDGSSIAFKTRSIVALVNKINSRNGEKPIVVINANVPDVKRSILIQNFQRSGIRTVSKITELGSGNVIPTIATEPKILAVSDVSVYDDIDLNVNVSVSYSFKIKYKVQSNSTYLKYADNNLEVESASKDYLTIMSKWFKKLIGKSNPGTNLAEIYKESRMIANKAFPHGNTKVNIMSNFSSIQFSHKLLKRNMALFIRKNLYAYN